MGFCFDQRHWRFLKGRGPPSPQPTPCLRAVIMGLPEVEELGAFIPPTDTETPTVRKVREIQREELWSCTARGAGVMGVGSRGE